MKLVVITSRFPYPIEKGDKLRIFHQIRLLAQYHDIVLLSITEGKETDEDLTTLKQYCSKIYTFPRTKTRIYANVVQAFLKGFPMQIGYFFDESIKKQIHTIIAEEQPDHLYCQLIRTAEYVKTLDIPKTIDYMDTFSIGAKRWSTRSHWVVRPFLKREAKKVAIYEANIFKHFNQHTIISAQDRDLFEFREAQSIEVVPNGIDTSFFAPFPEASPTYDLAFVGNMGYAPNVEAAKFFVKEILPLVKTHFPNIKLLIAGARPTKEVQQLASENVTISGWLEDIRTAYADSDIFVAPLFIGSGQQNKILEAMAMQIPCITTSLVNNAINGVPNESILIADHAEAFAKQILYLKNNPSIKKSISKEGLTYIRTNFSWNTCVNKLNNLLENPS